MEYDPIVIWEEDVIEHVIAPPFRSHIHFRIGGTMRSTVNNNPVFQSVDFGPGENGRLRLIAEVAGNANELVDAYRDLGYKLFVAPWKIVDINFTPGDDFESWTMQATAMLTAEMPEDETEYGMAPIGPVPMPGYHHGRKVT